MQNFDYSHYSAKQLDEFRHNTNLRANWRTASGFSYDNERNLDCIQRRKFLRTLATIVEMRIGKIYDAVEAGDIDERDLTMLWTPSTASAPTSRLRPLDSIAYLKNTPA